MTRRSSQPPLPCDSLPPGIGHALCLAILALSLSACSLAPSKVQAPAPSPPELGAIQVGVASWYGPGFHGRRTASGAIYDQYKLTAAHPTLPLGSRVMVTNLRNGRSVEVSINDRGPFMKGRIIDLSYAAAQLLGMVGPGTARVRLEVMDSPTALRTIRSNVDYTLQAGSFSEIENALRLKEKLTRMDPPASQISIVPFHGRVTTYYRVRVGTYSSRRDAESHARQLAREGFSIIIMEK